MRTVLTFALMTAIIPIELAGCSSATPSNATKPVAHEETPIPAGALAIDFAVGGMHCGGCADRIAGEISSIDGVVRCDVSFEDGAAHVVVTESGVKDRITSHLSEIGYSIKPADPDEEAES